VTGGSGLPGSGLRLYAVEGEGNGSKRGAVFFSLAFLPLLPVENVRLTPVSGDSEAGAFEVASEGSVPWRLRFRVWLKTLGLFAVALGPAAYVLPRIHETGVLPGVRLVVASLLPVLVATVADLSTKRLVRSRC
jgi:hypothetical protein